MFLLRYLDSSRNYYVLGISVSKLVHFIKVGDWKKYL